LREVARGYGKNALILWLVYLFDRHGMDTLYTQTWEGNYPMIALAKIIGFVECERHVGFKEWKGKTYDTFTFSISKTEFEKRYSVEV
jgi:RimJ/RimL family protein N-acetyltransferase